MLFGDCNIRSRLAGTSELYIVLYRLPPILYHVLYHASAHARDGQSARARLHNDIPFS